MDPNVAAALLLAHLEQDNPDLSEDGSPRELEGLVGWLMRGGFPPENEPFVEALGQVPAIDDEVSPLWFRLYRMLVQ